MTKKDPKQDSSNTESDEAKALKEQLEKLTDLAGRAQADLQNFKARQKKDAAELVKFAVTPLLLELLPVRDDLARAENHDGDTDGYEQILTKLDSVFAKIGLKKIDAMGEKADPAKHEVITTAPGEKDVVIEVHEEGYELNGRVLRPSKVIVGT
jgi:molecular chaperone GrpE